MPEDLILQLLKEIREVGVRLSELSHDLYQHISTEESNDIEVNKLLQKHTESLETVARLVKAFPHIGGEPDLGGHRTDHEDRMYEAGVAKKRWESVKTLLWEKVASGIFYAFLVIVALGVKEWMQHPDQPFVHQVEHVVNGGGK